MVDVPDGARCTVTELYNHLSRMSTRIGGVFMPGEIDRELLRVALSWLELGFGLLPCQPDTKLLVKGFGPHVRQIRTVQDVTTWFHDRVANIAVVGGAAVITLDFDDPGLYKSWSQQYPYIKTTLTGKTPGGGYHVWLYGTMPEGVRLVEGIELKTSVMVYPSVVDGKQYTQERGIIKPVQDFTIFSPLSRPGFRSPYLLNVIEHTQRYKSPEAIDSVITRIKAHYPITDMLQEVDPGLLHRLRPSGTRYLVGRCPFHDDHDTHFFIDTQLNIFSCHVCHTRGDVINLYAMLKDIPLKSAIAELRGKNRHE
jgi:hypothetical protein